MLLNLGMKKEDARAVLPANTSTKMYITGNLQGWNDAIKLRVSDHAQKEVRKMFIKIVKLLSEQYPQVFPDSLEYNGKSLNQWYNTI